MLWPLFYRQLGATLESNGQVNGGDPVFHFRTIILEDGLEVVETGSRETG